jgi:hypothetical protein
MDFAVAEAIDRIGLVGVTRRMQQWIHQLPEPIPALSSAATTRLLLEGLGPTYVKLGQIVSSQASAPPDDWRRELDRLENEVPPVPYESARQVILEELRAPPEDLFALSRPARWLPLRWHRCTGPPCTTGAKAPSRCSDLRGRAEPVRGPHEVRARCTATPPRSTTCDSTRGTATPKSWDTTPRQAPAETRTATSRVVRGIRRTPKDRRRMILDTRCRRFVGLIDRGLRVRIVLVFERFEGMSRSAAWQDLKFGVGHPIAGNASRSSPISTR